MVLQVRYMCTAIAIDLIQSQLDYLRLRALSTVRRSNSIAESRPSAVIYRTDKGKMRNEWWSKIVVYNDK